MANDTINNKAAAAKPARASAAKAKVSAAAQTASDEASKAKTTAAATLKDSATRLQRQASDKVRSYALDGKAKAGGALDEFSRLMNDAAGSDAQAFEADCYGQRRTNLERNFGEACGIAIDVAAIHGVTDFGKCQQHREQDCGRFDRALWRIVAAAAQEYAADPERKRGHAVTPQQPVEDRRGANGVAGDARLVSGAQHDKAGQDGGQRAQERDRSPQRNPGRAE